MGEVAVPGSPAYRASSAPSVQFSESFAKDAILSWFRGEFAAANAIIDSLCGHMVQESAGESGSEYAALLAAIHRRRLNWIPVLQMQKYHSIAEVTTELRKLTAKRIEEKSSASGNEETADSENKEDDFPEKVMEREAVDDDDSPDSDITDAGSDEAGHEHDAEKIRICTNHEEDCNMRPSVIRLAKRFSAKEQVRGHMVNVVKGLKLYEDVFVENELCRLTDAVNQLRAAGREGELSGETFIMFNTKGSKRELVQLGVPIFGHMKDDHSVNIEPIPDLFQSVIDHLVQWKLIPEYKRPNGCVISFFQENEYSQPFLKPPHLEQPFTTLLLSQSTMAFGHKLAVDSEGNVRGPLSLTLKEGSILVMRGNSADTARHVMCPSPNTRVSITFFRVRPDSAANQSTGPNQLPISINHHYPNIVPYGLPKILIMRPASLPLPPQAMLRPSTPMCPLPQSHAAGGGTGVFLPWTAAGSRKPAKQLPPRVKKLRLLGLRSVDNHDDNQSSASTEVGVS